MYLKFLLLYKLFGYRFFLNSRIVLNCYTIQISNSIQREGTSDCFKIKMEGKRIFFERDIGNNEVNI